MFYLIIVDDDETLLEGLSTAVDWSEMGLVLSAAAKDGVEALEAMQKHPCDILLTDIRMGRMDGLRLAEAVKKERPAVHIVMMSAYDDFSYAQQAMRLGVEDYLLKPIDLEQLHATMKKTLEKLAANRSRDSRLHTLNQRVEELSNQTAEEYLRISGAINTALIKHLCKVAALGNAEAVEINANRLWENICLVGDGSFLFTISAVNMLAAQAEIQEGFTAEQRKMIHAARREAVLRCSPREMLNSLRDALVTIAMEKAGEADDISGIIARARRYIDAHFSDSNLRVREVAAHVGLSSSYFSTMFAKYAGESFSDYLMALRIREAQTLLSNTTLHTYEIAAKVGYENSAYFSTLFKEVTGMTASQYRKTFRSQS